jgi:chromosome segregation ATPase
VLPLVLLPLGCTPITVDTINTATTRLRTSLASIKPIATETTAEVDSAYVQLKKFLDDRDLADEKVKLLESRHDLAFKKYRALESALHKSRQDGSSLFDMLRRRTRDNQTPSLRRKMISGINAKEAAFNSKIESAEGVMNKLRQALQKYDDIVGYFQVHKGLEDVAEHIADVEAIMKEGEGLSEELRGYVDEGLQMIENL